ncbi:hypothetical protein [Devosia sp.]|uniref:hypothetical protein n=1 Tax=Devosia sp. TaxID=1871048 RepID=UPI0025B9CDBE|nr:hypothetical protein [Devosia sp.]
MEFIRTPADFDRKLAWDSMQRTSLWKLDPSLAELSRRSVDEIKGRHQQKLLRDTHLLAAPDDYVLRKLKEAGIAQTGAEQGQFLAYMQRLRDEDPDFLEQVRPGERYAQLAMMTTGGAIENARLAAQMTGAYLFTDIELRWHLIKRDRAEHSAEEIQWSPFAKAMQGAKLTYLNNVGIEHALRLRQEGRLSGVRSVLRDAWLREQTGDVYDDVNTLRFAENLADAVSAADAEWSELKADLLKHGVVEGAAGLLAAGPLVAAGQSLWLAGAAATAIAGSAIYGRFRHRAFLKRFPAAFFMHLEGAD